VLSCFRCFFFFQAEDGIRDRDVTGVQTCALPILALLDTKHFFEAGIPCINFTTGIHNDYHKSSDDAKYVNYEALNYIRRFILFLVMMNH